MFIIHYCATVVYKRRLFPKLLETYVYFRYRTDNYHIITKKYINSKKRFESILVKRFRIYWVKDHKIENQEIK